MNIKNLVIALFCGAFIFVSCGEDDPCEGVSCPEGQTATNVGSACPCLVDINADPCDGVTCPDGFVPVANGTSCDCTDNPNAIGSVNVTGLLEGTVSWTKNNIYNLNGKVVVSDGATLNIEAGTVIKGAEGTGSLATALIVARGGTLNANGTAEAPIIFTSDQDQIMPGSILSPNLDETFNALWGGLVILGYAPISAGTGDTEAQIEGIPADDLFGRYGGDDPADNSGSITYISVRHGGTLIGENNEINGITLGGVGNGTTIENIEVVANLDDGVEWFGGTVNVRNVIVANGEDDGLDIDQNYSGTIDNAVVIQSGATAGDNAVEIDGPEGSTYTDGFFTINNLTLIDEDGLSDTAGDLKSKAQGTITNASWRGFTDNLKIRQSCEDDCMTTKSDTYENFINGTISIANSEWVGTATIADWTTVYGDVDCPGEEPCIISDAQQQAITDLLIAGDNKISSGATTGADLSAFDGWSWASANGKLN
jgi:hypothetical protein